MAINIDINLVTKGAERALKAIGRQTDKLEKNFGSLERTAQSAGRAIKSIGASFLRATANVVKFGAAATAAFAAFAVQRSIREAINLENSLVGLRSVARNTGQDVNKITEAAKTLSKDGLIPLDQVAGALKNLLATGLDGDKAVQVFKALRQAAAFNRQGQLSLGEAVLGAAQGIKNQNSIMVDNAGITKNLSVLQKEYAASINTTVGRLTEAQKRQAIYLGIIKESQLFQGDYNKLLGTFSGGLSRVGGSIKFLLAEFGLLITTYPPAIRLTKQLGDFLSGLVVTLNKNRKAIQDFVTAGINVLKDAFDILKSTITGVTVAVGVLGVAFAALSLGSLTSSAIALATAMRGIGFATLASAASFVNLKASAVASFVAMKASAIAFGAALGGATLGLTFLAVRIAEAREELKDLSKPFEIFFTALELRLEKAKLAFAIFTGFVNKKIADLIGVLGKLPKAFGGIGKSARGLANAIRRGVDENIRRAEGRVAALDRIIQKAFNEAQVRKFNEANKKVNATTAQTNQLVKRVNKNIKKTGTVSGQVANELKNQIKQIESIGLTQEQLITKQLAERQRLIADATKARVISEQKAADLLTRIQVSAAEKLSQTQEKEQKKQVQQGLRSPIETILSVAPQISDQFSNSLAGVGDNFVDIINNGGQLLQDSFKGLGGPLIGAGAGFLTSVTKGAAGAKKLLSSGAAAAADAFFPGAGAAVGPLVDALAAGPDAIKQQVREFAKAIPDLIENIILALPVLIEELALAIPDIITRIADKADVIIERLIAALPRVISALILAIPRIITALAFAIPEVSIALAKEMPFVGISLAREMPNVAATFVKELLAKLNKAGGSLKDIVSGDGGGGGGGIGGVIKSIGGKFGFARGGEPKLVSGGTPGIDSVPAALTPGELVIDRSTNQRLKNFLAEKEGGGGDGDMMATNALLAQIANILERPMGVSTSINVDGTSLADVILELNRNNARLA